MINDDDNFGALTMDALLQLRKQMPEISKPFKVWTTLEGLDELRKYGASYVNPEEAVNQKLFGAPVEVIPDWKVPGLKCLYPNDYFFDGKTTIRCSELLK